jgi:signal peptidase II
MSRRRPRLVTLLLFVGLVECDHATKRAAETRLAGRPPVEVVPGALDLRYAENPGVAFNLERVVPEPARLPIVGVAAAAALTATGLAWRRRAGELSATTVAYALIAAGTVGNLVDRVARGHVIDFVHVRYWPIFNVADASLVVGVFVLLLAVRRRALERPLP